MSADRAHRLDALFDRLLETVDAQAYLPLADVVPEDQKSAMSEIQKFLQQGDVSEAERSAQGMFRAGRIDRVMLCSALHVIAASPAVQDYEKAARMVAAQEVAALEQGGPRMQANLASVERHRGVLAFLMGQFGVALDYFSRAFERQHSPGNLANVLATLIRLGDEVEAQDLLSRVRTAFRPELMNALNKMIEMDPDLALLRDADAGLRHMPVLEKPC